MLNPIMLQLVIFPVLIFYVKSSSCQVSNCLKCDQNNNCLQCDWYHFLSDNQTCIKCDNPNNFIDWSQRRCFVCDNNCELCKSATECAPRKCKRGFAFWNNKCFKIDNTNCTQDCINCINNGQCVECKTNYFVYKNGCISYDQCDPAQGCKRIWWPIQICKEDGCATQCKENQFKDIQGNCKSCHLGCQTCIGELETNCLSCTSPKKMFKNKCIDKCPINTYHNISQNQCKNCYDILCKECSGPSKGQCKQCKSPFILINEKCSCPEKKFFQNNDCLDCDESCKSCSGGLRNQCLSCDSNKILYQDQCWESCPLQTFYNDLTKTCENCQEFALKCKDNEQIIECLNNLTLIDGKCQCKSNFYLDKIEKKCFKCNSKCQECFGPKQDQCSLCHQNQYSFEGICYQQCPQSTYADKSAKVCYQCHETCLTCQGPNNNQCLSCDSRSQLNQNQQCKQKNCHYTCERCSGPGEDQCLGCIRGRFLRDKRCILIKGNTNLCIGKLCDSKYCSTCECDQSKYCNLCNEDNCQIRDNCRCASTQIPGNLPLKDTPQFIILTIDDNLTDSYWELMDLENQIFAKESLKDSLGCKIKITYYMQTDDIQNYTYLKWFNQIGSIALHTCTHDTSSNSSPQMWKGEIENNIMYLRELSGLKDELNIAGARAPYLDSNNGWFEQLVQSQIRYDSSTLYITKYINNKQWRIWPHSLDFGTEFENYCQYQLCKTTPHPNLWEFPLQVMVDDKNHYNITMDPQAATEESYQSTLKLLKDNFIKNYNTNRVPLGLYTHPPWFNQKYAHKLITEFYGWITSKFDNIVYATEQEILDWIQSPVEFSKIKENNLFKCRDPTLKLCDTFKSCPDPVWWRKTFCVTECPEYWHSQRCWDQRCYAKYENSSNCPEDCKSQNSTYITQKQINMQQKVITEMNQSKSVEGNAYNSDAKWIYLSLMICVTLLLALAMILVFKYLTIKQKENKVEKVSFEDIKSYKISHVSKNSDMLSSYQFCMKENPIQEKNINTKEK